MGYTRWADWEDDLMREYYPTEGTEMAKRLDGRTKQAVWQRAMKLKLNVKPETLSRNISLHLETGWTDEERNILKDQYHNKDADIKKLIPRHSERACGVRASLNGITMRKPRWEDDELAILQEHIDSGMKELASLLPGRTDKAIGIMQSRMKKKLKES